MFAYLIIGIELAILYVVFWIVFLREPKQSEIRADLWGNYSDANEEIFFANNSEFEQPRYLIDREQLEFYLPSPPNIVRPPAYRTGRVSKMRRGHHFARKTPPQQSHNPACSCSCVCHTQEAGARKIRRRTWHWRNIEQPNIPKASRSVVEAFLVSLNHVLNRLSVKLP